MPMGAARRGGSKNQCGGSQRQCERSINDQQGGFRQAMFKAGSQTLRREMKIDCVRSGSGDEGRGQNGRNGFSRNKPLAQPFIPDRPEHRSRMMDYIADNRVSGREAILVRSVPSPDPLAGPVHGCSRVIQFRFAKDRKGDG